MTSVNAPGRGGLEIDVVSGQSAIVSAWASNPLKLLFPRFRGPSVWAYLSSFGGGFVAGDETSLDIRLGARTRAFVTTQAFTKIYRNPKGRPCGHRLNATLENGSFLVLAPEPIQAFAGSIYTQRQEFRLQSGAGLILLDWFCSGRTACGERWAFTRLQSSNELFVNGERVLIDTLLLDSSEGPLDNAHRLGRFNCLAVIVVAGNALSKQAACLLADAASQPVTRHASLIVTASPIHDGVLLRVAGEQVQDVSREIHQRLAFTSDILEDEPWARKW
ncbi:MAG: urease accessory protein UreD [Verrucomicrobiota bacterium]|jgi:urease accessory protein